MIVTSQAAHALLRITLIGDNKRLETIRLGRQVYAKECSSRVKTPPAKRKSCRQPAAKAWDGGGHVARSMGRQLAFHTA